MSKTNELNKRLLTVLGLSDQSAQIVIERIEELQNEAGSLRTANVLLRQDVQASSIHADSLAAQLAECAGYLGSVRMDRKTRDEHGTIYAAQTMEWAEGAAEIAERVNAALEAHDAMRENNSGQTAGSQPTTDSVTNK